MRYDFVKVLDFGLVKDRTREVTAKTVTTDGTYREYPTGRHLDFAYETILKGMQPGAMPEMSEEVKKRVEESEKVLLLTRTQKPGEVAKKTDGITLFLTDLDRDHVDIRMT